MKLVILESPLSGNVAQNTDYARECMKDCLMRGESPMVSHLLYTQCLDDNIPNERMLGIDAGFAWRKVADYTVVYTGLGISRGMQQGIDHAKKLHHKIEYRDLMPNSV